MGWFKRIFRKKPPHGQREDRSSEETSVELPLKSSPPATPPEPPSVTGIYETVKKDIDQATEEKKQARTTAQKLIDSLPEHEEKK